MNLHEYQGKQLFKEYGLPVSEGYAADTAQGAVEAADRIGGEEWVVKCQVDAGGRGKAGGGKIGKKQKDT
ncbi:MAG TPA: succinate--CoA ligase subunit beta, partial [Alteromonas mediterranea]|nr:succinate--CoA ligase subunit beta [Alteromonas mediterranea]